MPLRMSHKLSCNRPPNVPPSWQNIRICTLSTLFSFGTLSRLLGQKIASLDVENTLAGNKLFLRQCRHKLQTKLCIFKLAKMCSFLNNHARVTARAKSKIAPEFSQGQTTNRSAQDHNAFYISVILRNYVGWAE